MRLTAGARLGPYEVIGALGAGGMGEVYRARDTRLNRDVAIKILPDAFAHDPERLARFQREAEILASLNHQNIATIYGLEQADGLKAIVLELVEGPTLAERIAMGPGKSSARALINPGAHRAMSVADGIAIARQIADGLSAAHERGVVHRDLKPSNIKIRPDGTVKILDFGLAKLTDASAAGNDARPDLSASPTITSPSVMTGAGVILGTAAYMAPEQARGEAVDHQADIWAFGCVVFEMLAGRAAFNGRTVSDVVAAILRGDPEWGALPPMLHARLRMMLERCLEKEAADRYHSIADARVDLQKAASGGDSSLIGREGDRAQTDRRRTLRWMAVTAIVTAAAVAGVFRSLTTRQDAARVERFSHVLPDGQTLSQTTHSILALSPDDSSVVFAANGSLFLRRLDRLDADRITGTEGAPNTPVFSPDGLSIAYQDFAKGELRRIAITGGTPMTLAPVTNLFGASWGADDFIVYGQENGIWRVPATGGAPEAIVTINPGERVHGAQLLPDRRSILFTLRTSVGSRGWEDGRIVVQTLETGERKVIGPGRDARYLPTGHLVYGSKSVLFAVPFDVSRLETRGAAVPMVEGLRQPVLFPGTTGTAHFDVSPQGTLAYLPAGGPAGPVARELVAVSRNGEATPLIPDKRDYWRPSVSPDGTRLVVEVSDGESERLWVVDLKEKSATLLTLEGSGNVFSTWTPDGQSVVYRSNRADAYGIYRQAADGSSGPQLIFRGGDELMPGEVSRDGVLLFAQGEQTGRRAIFTLPLSTGGASEFLATPAMEHMPAFSPDGKWVAYASNESGRQEVYIRPYPPRDGLVRRVSENGGTAPIWAVNGSELFYRSAEGYMMAVPVRLGSLITLGRPQELFRVDGRFRTSGNAPAYDVDAEGRFIMVTTPENPDRVIDRVNIVVNWTEELKRVVSMR